jgi:hypothetical protein
VLPDATGSSNAGRQGCMNYKEKFRLASKDADKDEEILGAGILLKTKGNCRPRPKNKTGGDFGPRRHYHLGLFA